LEGIIIGRGEGDLLSDAQARQDVVSAITEWKRGIAERQSLDLFIIAWARDGAA